MSDDLEFQIKAKNLTQDAFNSVQAALKALEDQTQSNTEKGSAFAKYLDDLDPRASTLDGTFKNLKGTLEELWENPTQGAKDLASALASDLSSGLGAAGVAAGIAAAAIATLSVVGFELANHTAEAGEKIVDFSRVTGTATEQVGGMSAAATIAGGSLDGLQSMLTQVQRRLDEGGPAADKMNAALADLGINAAAFRAADPSDRVALLADGMQNAAGSTNLMSDALAIMGRSGVQNIGVLMKYTEDARASGEALSATWDNQTTKSAEDLGVATRTTGVELSALSATIGQVLIPAATLAVESLNRTILALEHIADLGGLVSGSWDLITGALGRHALASETEAAVTDTTNRLWAAAAKSGLDLSSATYDVANKMLALGFNMQVVAEQTGLSTEAVAELKTAMKEAAASGEAYGASLDTINGLLLNANPNIQAISASTRGWIVDMKNAGASMADMVAVSGLTVQQIQAITTASADAQKARELYLTSLQNVTLAEKGYTGVLATLSDDVVQAIRYDLQHKASIEDITRVYGVQSEVVKLVSQDLKDEEAAAKSSAETQKKLLAEVLKAEGDNHAFKMTWVNEFSETERKATESQFSNDAKAIAETEKLQTDLYDTIGSKSGSALNQQLANEQKWYDDQVLKAIKAGVTWQGYYDALWATDQKNKTDILAANDPFQKAQKTAQLALLTDWNAFLGDVYGGFSKTFSTDIVGLLTGDKGFHDVWTDLWHQLEKDVSAILSDLLNNVIQGFISGAEQKLGGFLASLATGGSSGGGGSSLGSILGTILGGGGGGGAGVDTWDGGPPIGSGVGGPALPGNPTVDNPYFKGGGVVYAAHGWMQPKGTDTVPAMLSPGEGVLTTGAMEHLGREGLNHLNRGGSLGAVDTSSLERHAQDHTRLLTKMNRNLERMFAAQPTMLRDAILLVGAGR